MDAFGQLEAARWRRVLHRQKDGAAEEDVGDVFGASVLNTTERARPDSANAALIETCQLAGASQQVLKVKPRCARFVFTSNDPL